MDSDSDHFESADEEFADTEDHNNSSRHNQTDHNYSKQLDTIKNISLRNNTEKNAPSEVSQPQINDNQLNLDQKNFVEGTGKIDDENNVAEESKTQTEKPRVVQRQRPQKAKETKSKLGVRLGSDNGAKSEIFWQVYAEAKKNEYSDPPRLVQCWEGDEESCPVEEDAASKSVDLEKRPQECEKNWQEEKHITGSKESKVAVGTKLEQKQEQEENIPQEFHGEKSQKKVSGGESEKEDTNVNADALEKLRSEIFEEDFWAEEEEDLWRDALVEKRTNKKQETLKFGYCWPGEEGQSKKPETSQGNPPENLWEEKETRNKQSSEEEIGGWGNWGTWGVSSLLSTATQGVSTLTTNVSQSITSALELGIGAPDPMELAKLHSDQKQLHPKNLETDFEGKPTTSRSENQPQIGFGLGNLVSGVSHITKLVESTGSKVLTGGLDTLEVIGKKTMEVLQEGDPGLKKKRALLGINEKPVLSQVLREAKEKAEEEDKMFASQKNTTPHRPHFETIFDDHQGLVHLEALEMLSKQCDIKLETLIESYSGGNLTDLQETMAQIKELCELPDEEDENLDFGTVREKIETAVKEMSVAVTYDHFLSIWEEINEWLQKCESGGVGDVHQKAIESLAQLTAVAVEQFHKAGELLLVKERRSTVDEADSLVQLTVIFSGVIGLVAGKFSEKLNALANGDNNSDDVNSLITNIFLEAANSSSYIQDAFSLMIPVLQVGAV